MIGANFRFKLFLVSSDIPICLTILTFIIGLKAQSTLNFINDMGKKTSGNPIFEMKVVTQCGLTTEHCLQFTTIKDAF